MVNMSKSRACICSSTLLGFAAAAFAAAFATLLWTHLFSFLTSDTFFPPPTHCIGCFRCHRTHQGLPTEVVPQACFGFQVLLSCSLNSCKQQLQTTLVLFSVSSFVPCTTIQALQAVTTTVCTRGCTLMPAVWPCVS